MADTRNSRWAATGAIVFALAVALGAFGTHALREQLDADSLRIWATAQQYHAWHGLGLILLALLGVGGWPLRLVCAGLALFSGSLYLLALTGIGWLGAITPLGGACWIAAWVWSAFLLMRESKNEPRD